MDIVDFTRWSFNLSAGIKPRSPGLQVDSLPSEPPGLPGRRRTLCHRSPRSPGSQADSVPSEPQVSRVAGGLCAIGAARSPGSQADSVPSEPPGLPGSGGLCAIGAARAHWLCTWLSCRYFLSCIFAFPARVFLL